MSSPPAPPGRLEKKYTQRPSDENAGSKSLASELNGAGSGLLQLASVRRDIHRFQPPGPPGRSVEPHRSIVPSGLAASRISPNSLDTMPGATSSAAEVMASVAGPAAGTVLEPEGAAPHAAQRMHDQMRIAGDCSCTRCPPTTLRGSHPALSARVNGACGGGSPRYVACRH